jgi:prophage tail gpP-like protein
LPSLKLINQTWLISEVTYHRGEDGTTAEVVLMPPSAFVPQKEILVPYDRQIEAPGGAQAPGALPK